MKNPEEIHLDCGNSSRNISGVQELIWTYVWIVGNTTEKHIREWRKS
jgi:hypothetical protein